MADDLDSMAMQVCDLIRAQNWKNGGVHVIDRDEAAAAVLQLVRTAYAAGAVDGSRATGDSMLRAFDATAVLAKRNANDNEIAPRGAKQED